MVDYDTKKIIVGTLMLNNNIIMGLTKKQVPMRSRCAPNADRLTLLSRPIRERERSWGLELSHFNVAHFSELSSTRAGSKRAQLLNIRENVLFSKRMYTNVKQKLVLKY